MGGTYKSREGVYGINMLKENMFVLPGAHDIAYMTPSLPGDVLIAANVLTSHTLMVPSNDAVAI